MNIDKKTIIEREINRRIEEHKEDGQLVKILKIIEGAYVTIFCSDQTLKTESSE